MSALLGTAATFGFWIGLVVGVALGLVLGIGTCLAYAGEGRFGEAARVAEWFAAQYFRLWSASMCGLPIDVTQCPACRGRAGRDWRAVPHDRACPVGKQLRAIGLKTRTAPPSFEHGCGA